MKKILLFGVALASITISTLFNAPEAHTRSAGAPSQHAGAPAENNQTCAKSGCHAGTAQDRDNMITTTIPASGYIPGEIYTITVGTSEGSVAKWGFQATIQNASGGLQGSYVITNAAQTQFPTQGSFTNKYITHTTAGNSTTTTGSKSWSFDWIAPTAGTGDVTIYATVNASNNQGNASGDLILKDILTVSENISTSIQLENAENLFTIFPNPSSGLHVKVNIPSQTAFTVYNALGKQVLTKQMEQGLQQLDVSELPSGLYFAWIDVDGKKQMKRFVRQ
jgi:hypothetical protein